MIIKKVSLLLLALFMTVMMMAQSNGDKLFLEGQKLQKSLTVASQNLAIKKFRAAKVVYTTAAKKEMCDNQITICQNNIRSLRKKTSVAKPVDETPKTEQDTIEVVKPVKVELSLSETRLDFKCNPKEGATQSVKVICNYEDWKIAAKPEWLEVYTSKDKISIEVQENKDEDARSGIVTVQCHDADVNLIVNQNGVKVVDKIMGGFKGLFKKKDK